MPTANWPVPAIFILSLFLLPVIIINLVRTCLRTHIGGGRQFSRNICTIVQVSCRGGEIITVETRSEGDDET